MSNEQWKRLEFQPPPTVEEVRTQAREESVLFPAPDVITEDWISLSQTYQFLFSSLMLERTGLDKLDERIAQRRVAPTPDDKKGYYQKFDRLGLRYFYLRCCARVERLSEEERKALAEARDAGTDESWISALAIVSDTFQRVMRVNPESPETTYEPLETIHGDYQVKGKEIPLAMRSVAEFNPDGSLVSEERETERLRLFTRIWEQLDAALSKDLGCPVKTVVEAFLV